MLFFGEEWGAPEPFLYFADWQGELRDAVRAGRRREFGHDAGSALPDPCSAETFARSRPDSARLQTPAGQAWNATVRAALQARHSFITPRQDLLAAGSHSAQRIGERGLAVQWRYDDGQMLGLELNLGPAPLRVPPQHLGPVEARCIFSHRWGSEAGTWPAWAARWTLGGEITL
jgi:1,4-alpha-glucan branching enzyme/maltooligosyltrehalose trehalohydrolase